MYFGCGYAVRFSCILRDRWKNLGNRYGPPKGVNRNTESSFKCPLLYEPGLRSSGFSTIYARK